MTNINDLISKIVAKWGTRAQLEMAMEESLELALALRKYLRCPDEKSRDGLIDEIADIQIMLKQIDYIFQDTDLSKLVYNRMVFKWERIEKRLNS